MKILCMIPSLPEDLNDECLKSVLAQTLPVSMLVLLTERLKEGTLPERISEILNRGLASLKIENFDYILRVDGDTVLPRNFLEENLKDTPDLCGKGGYAHIIKAKSFIEVLKGRFPRENDDTYINLKFQMLGLKVTNWHVAPMTRVSGTSHGIKYFWNRGIFLYQLGYEPVHLLADILLDVLGDKRNFVSIFGYLNAVLKRLEKFDIAVSVWKYQTRRLFFGKDYALRSGRKEIGPLISRFA